uniref:Trichome birefringence-like C-terminal domain-containing protein n=2 Tax=Oryza meridionalis TaxID=40149 RepID=A0A0E0DSP7_9ORYZ
MELPISVRTVSRLSDGGGGGGPVDDASAGASEGSRTKATDGDGVDGWGGAAERRGWWSPRKERRCAQEEGVPRTIWSRIWRRNPSHPTTARHAACPGCCCCPTGPAPAVSGDKNSAAAISPPPRRTTGLGLLAPGVRLPGRLGGDELGEEESNHRIIFVNKAMRPNGVKLFRTQSPRHFEGGDWNEGGSCQRDKPLSAEEVEELFSLDNNGTNVEARLVNQHLALQY